MLKEESLCPFLNSKFGSRSNERNFDVKKLSEDKVRNLNEKNK